MSLSLDHYMITIFNSVKETAKKNLINIQSPYGFENVIICAVEIVFQQTCLLLQLFFDRRQVSFLQDLIRYDLFMFYITSSMLVVTNVVSI